MSAAEFRTQTVQRSVAKKARVSLCMIVRDEAQNLEACLSPVAELVDEIVIVDTGSQDSTKAIASRFTSHLHDFAWCDDFAAARNESLRHATGEWIFWLDADDRIRADQFPALRKAIAELDDRPRVLMMDVLSCPSTSRWETQTVSHARLFLRHPDMRWHGRVHEQISPCIETLGYQRFFTGVQIEHLGYTDSARTRSKGQQKLRLLRMEYALNPQNPCTLLHLAAALCSLRRTEEAQLHLTRLFRIAASNRDCLRWTYEMQVHMLLTQGKPHEALEFACRGAAVFPCGLQLLYLRAMAEFALEDYSAAAATLQRLIEAPPTDELLYGSFANLQTKLGPRLLAIIRRLQGADDESEALLQCILSAHPTDSAVWYELGLLNVDRHNPQGLKGITQQLRGLEGGDFHAALLVALWHLRHGDRATAGQLIDRLIASHPHEVRPKMLQAEWLSTTNAPLDAQIRALRDIVRIAPADKESQRFLELALETKRSIELQEYSFVACPGVHPLVSALAIAVS